MNLHALLKIFSLVYIGQWCRDEVALGAIMTGTFVPADPCINVQRTRTKISKYFYLKDSRRKPRNTYTILLETRGQNLVHQRVDTFEHSHLSYKQ